MWKRIKWAEAKELYELGVKLECFRQEYKDGTVSPYELTYRAEYLYDRWDKHCPIDVSVE